MSQSQIDPMLDYQLTDCLEMNYSQNPQAVQRVKSKLFETKRLSRLHTLELLYSFRLNDQLIVIHKHFPRPIRKLLFLNSDHESIQEVGVEK